MAGFHAHLSAEKALEAVLIRLGVEVPRMHDLVGLHRLLPESVQTQFDVGDFEVLNPWTIDVQRTRRYGTPLRGLAGPVVTRTPCSGLLSDTRRYGLDGVRIAHNPKVAGWNPAPATEVRSHFTEWGLPGSEGRLLPFFYTPAELVARSEPDRSDTPSCDLRFLAVPRSQLEPEGASTAGAAITRVLRAERWRASRSDGALADTISPGSWRSAS